MKNPMRRERDKKRALPVISEFPLSNVSPGYNEKNIMWDRFRDAETSSPLFPGTMPDLISSPLSTKVYHSELTGGYAAETSADDKRVLGHSEYENSPLRAAQKSHNNASNARIEQASKGYRVDRVEWQKPHNLGSTFSTRSGGAPIKINSNPTRVTPNQFDGN
jgi:hypothetical protein